MTTFLQVSDNAVSTLASGINDSVLALSVDTGDGAKYPGSGAYVVTLFDEEPADGEQVLVDSRSGDAFTINAAGRGYNGTTAASWPAGTNVQLLFVAKLLEDVHDAINDIEDGTTTLSIDTADLVDGAVTAAKLADDAVTAAKIADDAVVRAALGDDAVGAAELDETGDYTVNDLTADGDLTVNGFLSIGPHVEYTIASGAITVANSNVKVDTEGDAASDDLVTINGGSTGDLIALQPQAESRTVVVKHGTGNILTIAGADKTLDSVHDIMWLMRNGPNWVQLDGR